MIAVPKWQRNLHFTTELAALLFAPLLYKAAQAVDEPHKTRLMLFLVGVLLIDGFFVIRWMTT